MQFDNYFSIPNYPGYLINRNGDVYSKKKNLLLAVRKRKDGYYDFKVYNNHKKKRLLLHKILAETFIDNPLNRPEVNHIDGDKSNFSIDNLEWQTSSGNIKHAYNNGLKENTRQKARETARTNRKLTMEEANTVRNEYKPHCTTMNQLSQKYNVNIASICRIINNKLYKEDWSKCQK